MEEEKIPSELEPETTKQEDTSPVPEGSNGTDAAPAASPDDVNAAESAEELPPLPSPIGWDFGERQAPPRPFAKRKFFLMFGAVFGVCAILLALTLWIGDTGFKIVKTVQHERTVYVNPEGEISGTLSSSEVADRVRASTVTVSARSDEASGIGSGFVWSADGYICTNYHVIEGMDTVQVVLADGRVFDAAVRGYNAAADIAVLKIDVSGLTPIAVGASSTLLVGESVVAVGTPAQLDFAGTATFGKVSAINRLVPISNADGSVSKKMTLIQTDTSVNPGNSGGPLANMNGEIVGIVVMKISGTGYDGMGFAIPIDAARPIITSIVATGRFTGENLVAEGASTLGVYGHGAMGGYWYSDEPDPTTGVTQRSETAQYGYHYVARDGVYVMEVTGEQAVAKLRAGDIILAVNGLQVVGTPELIDAVNRYYAGETVTLTVLRGSSVASAGEVITVTVTLAERDIT